MTFHEPEVSNSDQGLYPKYVVFKHPKEDAVSFMGIYLSEAKIPKYMENVEDFTFVLKPLNDRHARLAMAVYAESVRKEKPRLAQEIKEMLDDFQGS